MLVPTLDHVVINVRDRLELARDVFTRLGFALTPRGEHTLGSINHLAMFGTEYLELIAVPPGTTRRTDVLARPDGLNGIVFGTEDAETTHAALEAAGLAVRPPQQFSRPVLLPHGPQDARFATVHLQSGTVPAGRVYFCQHFTRFLVWRDEWREHPNGTVGITRIVLAAADPAKAAEPFAAMFGPQALTEIAGGLRLVVGLTSLDLLTPDAVAAQFGMAAPDGQGRPSWLAALGLRVRALDRAAAAISVPHRQDAGRIIVDSTEAFGTALEFTED